MKFLILGCGSIGSRHVRNLIKLGFRNIVLCDTNAERWEPLRSEFGLKKFYTDYKVAVAKEAPKAALVCTPTSTHLQLATFLISNDIDVFVEKPLSTDTRGIAELRDEIQKRKLILMVGMCYRFHPCLTKLKQVLKNLGRIFGDPTKVFCLFQKISSLEIDTEDMATFIFTFKDKSVVKVDVNYFQPMYTNTVEVVGENGRLFCDIGNSKIRTLLSGKAEDFSFEEDTNAMYLNEISHFIKCVKTREKPAVDVEEGEQDLHIIEKAKQSWEQKRMLDL